MKSKKFKEKFEFFLSMFKEEGDVYQDIKQTILEGEASSSNERHAKQILVKILDLAAIQYYSTIIEIENPKTTKDGILRKVSKRKHRSV